MAKLRLLVIEISKHRDLQSAAPIWFKSLPLQCVAFLRCALIYCKVAFVNFVEKEGVKQPLPRNEWGAACIQISIMADVYISRAAERFSQLYETFSHNVLDHSNVECGSSGDEEENFTMDKRKCFKDIKNICKLMAKLAKSMNSVVPIVFAFNESFSNCISESFRSESGMSNGWKWQAPDKKSLDLPYCKVGNIDWRGGLFRNVSETDGNILYQNVLDILNFSRGGTETLKDAAIDELCTLAVTNHILGISAKDAPGSQSLSSYSTSRTIAVEPNLMASDSSSESIPEKVKRKDRRKKKPLQNTEKQAIFGRNLVLQGQVLGI